MKNLQLNWKPVSEKHVSGKPVLCWHLPFAFYTSIENPVTEKPVTEKPVTEKPVSEKTVSEKPVLCLHLPFNTSIKNCKYKPWYKKNL